MPIYKIAKLYENDSKGIIDDELINDIGFTIYMRCLEGQEVMDAVHKMRVKCRSCSNIIVRKDKRNHNEVLACQCGWKTTWGHYRQNTLTQNMCNGQAAPFFTKYITKWESAKNSKQKMLFIDWLIHQFHIKDNIPGRAVGTNIISGTKTQVADLIINLSYGNNSIALLKAKREYMKLINNWKKKLIEFLGGNSKARLVGKKLGIENSNRIPLDVLIDKLSEIDKYKLKELLNE